MSQNKLKKIFLVGILLSAFTNAKPNLSESKNTQANNYKLLDKKRSFIYAENVTHRVIGSRIITRFTPKNRSGQKIAPDKLALDLGYDHFNWVNYVERDPYGMSDRAGRVLSTPYNDPPLEGYIYDSADSLPFYQWTIDN